MTMSIPSYKLSKTCTRDFQEEVKAHNHSTSKIPVALSAEIARAILPTALLNDLETLLTPGGPCAVAINGVPTKNGAWSWFNIGALTAAGKTCYGYLQEHNGAVPQVIRPMTGKEQENSNAGRVKLGYHSDNSALSIEYRPEGISLTGLYAEAEVETLVLPIETLVAELGPWVKRIMRDPRFRLRTPESFDFNGNLIYSEPRPILEWNEALQAETISYAEYSTLAAGNDPDAEAVLTLMRQLLASIEPLRFNLQPGVMVCFSQLTSIHGRGAVSGRRELGRTYFNRNLAHGMTAANNDQYSPVLDAKNALSL